MQDLFSLNGSCTDGYDSYIFMSRTKASVHVENRTCETAVCLEGLWDLLFDRNEAKVEMNESMQNTPLCFVLLIAC